MLFPVYEPSGNKLNSVFWGFFQPERSNGFFFCGKWYAMGWKFALLFWWQWLNIFDEKLLKVANRISIFKRIICQSPKVFQIVWDREIRHYFYHIFMKKLEGKLILEVPVFANKWSSKGSILGIPNFEVNLSV